jgi:carboxylesterase
MSWTLTMTGAGLAWLASDFLYDRVVHRRLAEWERSVERDPDGVRRGCRDFMMGSGRHAILLVHGFNDSPRVYQRMATVLAGEGYACRAMRLPGFAIPIPDTLHYRGEDWLEAVRRELQQLRAEYDQVSVVGHSLGGAILVNVLAREPALADRAVLLAPAIAVSNARSPLLPTRTWHSIGCRTLVFSRLTESPFRFDAQHPAAEHFHWMSRFAYLSTYAELFALFDGAAASAPEFRLPLLMAISPLDRVVDSPAAQRFFETAPSPQKQLIVHEQAGHALPIEEGWEELTREIAKFCRTSTASAAPKHSRSA